MADDVVTLQCKYPDGTAGQGVLYHMVQVDAANAPIAPPLPLTATSNQASIVNAFVSGLDVDIRAVGVKPGNISQALVEISDGRTLNGQPIKFVVQVNLQEPPNASALRATKDAVRNL